MRRGKARDERSSLHERERKEEERGSAAFKTARGRKENRDATHPVHRVRQMILEVVSTSSQISFISPRFVQARKKEGRGSSPNRNIHNNIDVERSQSRRRSNSRELQDLSGSDGSTPGTEHAKGRGREVRGQLLEFERDEKQKRTKRKLTKG